MDRFNALDRGMQIMFVAGVLLLIDTFLPWQDIAFPFDELGGLADELGVQTSVNAWNGLFGVLLGLLTIVLVAWVVVRLAAANIPLPVSSAMTAALLGTLIPFFAVTKALFQEQSTIWAYIGAVLAVLVGVGAWQTVQAAGGVQTLKSEIPSKPPATGASPRAASDGVNDAPPASEPPSPETGQEPAVKPD